MDLLRSEEEGSTLTGVAETLGSSSRSHNGVRQLMAETRPDRTPPLVVEPENIADALRTLQTSNDTMMRPGRGRRGRLKWGSRKDHKILG